MPIVIFSAGSTADPRARRGARRADGHRPRLQRAAAGPQVVLDVAREARRLLGDVARGHLAEEEAQSAVGAHGPLQPPVVRALHEAHERRLAALLEPPAQRRRRDAVATVSGAGGAAAPPSPSGARHTPGSTSRAGARRASAASMSPQCRSSTAASASSARAANSGSTSLPNSSIASQMCSWRFLPACMTKISSSTPARLVARDELADLVGRPDRAAQRPEPLLEDLHAERRRVGVDDPAREADRLAAALELLVDVRAPRAVVAEHVVVRERVAEEVRAVDAALDRLLLVGVDHHRQRDGDLRVDREAGRGRSGPRR